MGLLDLLFGSKPKPRINKTNHSKPAKDLEYWSKDLIQIHSINFMGSCKKSKSGEWLICWRDGNSDGSIGGHRDSGHGRYVLYNLIQNRVVVTGELERPQDGQVADNGTFSLEDWQFGGRLSGIFYVFSCSGEILIKKELNANIARSALSTDGKYAVCQTANNRDHEDGNTFHGFDVVNKAQLFSCHPETGWGDGYDFDTETPYFFVKVKNVGKFKYDKNGVFLDKKKYELAQLKSKEFSHAIFAADEIIKEENLSTKRAQLVLDAMINARSNGADSDPQWKAHALKLQGLANDFLGNKEEALKNLEEALSLNPKIGVKRKIDSLKKETGR